MNGWRKFGLEDNLLKTRLKVESTARFLPVLK